METHITAIWSAGSESLLMYWYCDLSHYHLSSPFTPVHRVVVCWFRLLSRQRSECVCQSFFFVCVCWLFYPLNQYMCSNLYMVNHFFMILVSCPAFFQSSWFCASCKLKFSSAIFVLCQRCTHTLPLSFVPWTVKGRMQERDKAALSNLKQGIKFHFPAMKRWVPSMLSLIVFLTRLYCFCKCMCTAPLYVVWNTRI